MQQGNSQGNQVNQNNQVNPLPPIAQVNQAVQLMAQQLNISNTEIARRGEIINGHENRTRRHYGIISFLVLVLFGLLFRLFFCTGAKGEGEKDLT